MKKGDFEALALPLADPLYNFARWLSGNDDEAQDLVQETYAKALKNFSSFREGSNVKAWMFRILRNTFLNTRTGLSHRSTRQEDDEGMAGLAVTEETPELLLLRRADTELVREAIGMLPAPFQEVLILADLEDLRYQEIAEALDIPAGTVMSRLSRARKLLRQRIAARLADRGTPGVEKAGVV